MKTRGGWIACFLVACSSNAPAASSAPDASAPADAVAAQGCSASDLTKCEYPERKLAVTEREGLSVKDANTGRTLPLLVRIPAGKGPFPVVIWSHGGAFSDTGQRLGREWGSVIASQGYVVFHPAHVELTPEAGKAICTLASIPSAECKVDPSDEEGPVVGIVKAFDIIAVLDKLEMLSNESVARGGPALDLSRVATAGWSGGSRGPVTLLGGRMSATPSVPRFARPDERIVAAIGISTAGPGFGGYFDEGAETSWTVMRGPFLMLTGVNDIKAANPTLTGPIRRFPFTAQPSDGTRHLLYSTLPVGVGDHFTYNLEDASSSDERLQRLSRALRSTALAFLDAYVIRDANAKAWLATNDARVLAGDAGWEHR